MIPSSWTMQPTQAGVTKHPSLQRSCPAVLFFEAVGTGTGAQIDRGRSRSQGQATHSLVCCTTLKLDLQEESSADKRTPRPVRMVRIPCWRQAVVNCSANAINQTQLRAAVLYRRSKAMLSNLRRKRQLPRANYPSTTVMMVTMHRMDARTKPPSPTTQPQGQLRQVHQGRDRLVRLAQNQPFGLPRWFQRYRAFSCLDLPLDLLFGLSTKPSKARILNQAALPTTATQATTSPRSLHRSAHPDPNDAMTMEMEMTGQARLAPVVERHGRLLLPMTPSTLSVSCVKASAGISVCARIRTARSAAGTVPDAAI